MKIGTSTHSIVDNILCDKIYKVLKASVHAFCHSRVIEVAAVEETVVARRFKLLEKCRFNDIAGETTLSHTCCGVRGVHESLRAGDLPVHICFVFSCLFHKPWMGGVEVDAPLHKGCSIAGGHMNTKIGAKACPHHCN